MGLFDKFKQDNKVLSIGKDFSNTAVEYAKSFDKELDYSSNSIKDLEEILDWYSKDIEKSKPTENQIWSMAMIFGAYLGQTIIKSCDKEFKWADEGDNIPVLKKGTITTAPVDKVYKRLVNGPEDSVESFYRVIEEKLYK